MIQKIIIIAIIIATITPVDKSYHCNSLENPHRPCMENELIYSNKPLKLIRIYV